MEWHDRSRVRRRRSRGSRSARRPHRRRGPTPAGTTSRRRARAADLRGSSDLPPDQGPSGASSIYGDFPVQPRPAFARTPRRMTTVGPEPPLLPVRALVLVLAGPPSGSLVELICTSPRPARARSWNSRRLSDERPLVEERHAISEASLPPHAGRAPREGGPRLPRAASRWPRPLNGGGHSRRRATSHARRAPSLGRAHADAHLALLLAPALGGPDFPDLPLASLTTLPTVRAVEEQMAAGDETLDGRSP